MTYSTENRQRNCKRALQVMWQLLGDDEIAETVFNSDGPEFTETIRTTWTDLCEANWVEKTEVDGRYRLTGFGWLQALKITGELKQEKFRKRLETTLASMKSFVKGRRTSAEVRLRDLAAKASVPERWLFNVIESRLIEEFHGRKGPHWDKRMVVIPAEFDMVSLEVDALLSGEAENRIAELKADLDEAREQLKQYRCPYCGSALSSSGPVPLSEHDEGYFESFECGHSSVDGFEQSLCPGTAPLR